MGVSKLPEDLTPERWQLIFYIVSTCDDKQFLSTCSSHNPQI